MHNSMMPSVHYSTSTPLILVSPNILYGRDNGCQEQLSISKPLRVMRWLTGALDWCDASAKISSDLKYSYPSPRNRHEAIIRRRVCSFILCPFQKSMPRWEEKRRKEAQFLNVAACRVLTKRSTPCLISKPGFFQFLQTKIWKRQQSSVES